MKFELNKHSEHTCYGFSISKDSKYIALLADSLKFKDTDITIQIKDISDGKLVEEIKDGYLYPSDYSIDWNHNNSQIAYISGFSNLKLININSGKIEEYIIKEKSFKNSIKFSPDSNFLIISFEDKNYIDIISFPQLTLIQRIVSKFSNTNNLPLFSLTKNNFLAVYFSGENYQGEIKVINLESFKIINEIDLGDISTQIIFKNNCELFHTLEPYPLRFTSIYNFNILKNNVDKKINFNTLISNIFFHPLSEQLFCCLRQEEYLNLCLLNYETGQIIYSKILKTECDYADFTKDGKFLITYDYASKIEFWNFLF